MSQVTGTISQQFLAKGKDTPVLSKTPRVQTVLCSGFTAALILNSDTNRRVASFKLHALYFRAKIPQHQMNRNLVKFDGHQKESREGNGVHKVLVGKPEGKRPLGETKT